MQEASLAFWDDMVLAENGKDDSADDLGDFGWLGPFPETLELCQMVVMSKYQFWPESGGYLDQPEWFQHDFRLFMRGYVMKLREHTPEPTPQPAGSDNAEYDMPDFASLG